MEKIKNINGTTETSSNCENCGSWISHWSTVGAYKVPDKCIVVGCTENNNTKVEGAHVQKADNSDNKWYIAPLCHTHNMKKDTELNIHNYNWLVLANVSETCGK